VDENSSLDSEEDSIHSQTTLGNIEHQQDGDNASEDNSVASNAVDEDSSLDFEEDDDISSISNIDSWILRTWNSSPLLDDLPEFVDNAEDSGNEVDSL